MKGLRSMPILPKNMMYVKEHNPKFFKARICYLLFYFVILVLFAVYAIGGFIAYIRTYNQTVLTSTVGREDKITFPVIMVCPLLDAQTVDVSKASIDFCGSAENVMFSKCGSYIDQPDTWDKMSKSDEGLLVYYPLVSVVLIPHDFIHFRGVIKLPQQHLENEVSIICQRSTKSKQNCRVPHVQRR